MKALLQSDRAVRRRENYQKDKRALRMAERESKKWKPVWEPHARKNPRLALSYFGIAGKRAWSPGSEFSAERYDEPVIVRGLRGRGEALGRGLREIRKGGSIESGAPKKANIEAYKRARDEFIRNPANKYVIMDPRNSPKIEELARRERAKVALVRGQRRL